MVFVATLGVQFRKRESAKVKQFKRKNRREYNEVWKMKMAQLERIGAEITGRSAS